MSPSIEVETTIARARDAVYAYVATAENLPAWAHDIRTVEPLDPGPAEPGAAFRVRLAQAPITTTIRWTAVEPGRALAWEGERVSVGIASVVPRGAIELDDVDGGTRVRARIEPELSGALRLAHRFIAGELREGREADLRRLRELLEGEAKDAGRARPAGPRRVASDRPG